MFLIFQHIVKRVSRHGSSEYQDFLLHKYLSQKYNTNILFLIFLHKESQSPEIFHIAPDWILLDSGFPFREIYVHALLKVLNLWQWHTVSKIFSHSDPAFAFGAQTWYLSRISRIIFVEKKLPFGEISVFHVWQLWENWKFLHILKNFRTIDGVLLQFMPFCC